jgi:hypothetical protein
MPPTEGANLGKTLCVYSLDGVYICIEVNMVIHTINIPPLYKIGKIDASRLFITVYVKWGTPRMP